MTIQAKQDIDDLVDFFFEHDPELPNRFLTALDEAYEIVSRTPRIGPATDFENSVLAGMRMRRVPHFDKYLIFYIPFDDRIEIIRVLDGRRDCYPLFSESALTAVLVRVHISQVPGRRRVAAAFE